jgi:hypothetical protein
MTRHVPDPIHAVADRGAAMRRVRRVTGALVATTAALAGIFTALAAGSTPHPRRATPPATQAPAPREATVVAPAPPLVGLRQAAPAPPPASQTPAPAPTPAAAPPVVVSGGS